ncbi:MAG: aminodeoxychorismate/anthranilate synthase component II [Desulfobacterota bacterium]|nr:aminodeoxychorismate/anthranilate synthase component II [Thermodesulfobacteriota bacterium]
MGTQAAIQPTILLIDNYDSFTYNLYQLFVSCGAHVVVAEHDRITLRDIRRMGMDAIVLSAGPGKPERSSICMAAIRHFFRRIPMLGVCLGHQYIGTVFGSRVIHARRILHGATSLVYHTGKGIFFRLPNPFQAARYHSLALETVPRDFYLTAWSDDGDIMGIAHMRYPVFGIQFHPESFMTEAGAVLVRNFLNVCYLSPS